MRYDFTDVTETEDFASLPQGWYTVKVEEVRELAQVSLRGELTELPDT